MRLTPVLAVAALFIFPVNTQAASPKVAGALAQEHVLGYLEQVIQWQRDTAAVQPVNAGPGELIFQETLYQNGLRALRAGFKFARAQASIAPADKPDDAEVDSSRQRLQQRAVETDRRIADVRAKLQGKLPSAERLQLEGQLKIEQAQQELFETVQANFNAAASGGGLGFSAKIGNLQRGVPEMLDDGSKPAAAKPVMADMAASSAVGNGLIGLSGRLFSIARKQRELEDHLDRTAEVEANGRAMLTALRGELDAITAPEAANTTPVAARMADFKQIATVVAPLAEANVWVSSSTAALKEWDRTLSDQFMAALRQFAIRMALLLVMISVPLVLGEVAERTIDRYVIDAKRRRQAHTTRRVLVAVAVLFILLLNFITDFSAFATFAGFLTAGLALALQGVLLSLVAHFFFYGRYGVRVGDRINVAGVTGYILKIGMVRFYLQELENQPDGSLKPTGKMVAFPNSILFQPSAFYKYV